MLSVITNMLSRDTYSRLICPLLLLMCLWSLLASTCSTASILDNRVCLKRVKSGKCKAYTLKYKNKYSLKDYLDELHAALPVGKLLAANDIDEEYTAVVARFINHPEEGTGILRKFIPETNVSNYEEKAQQQALILLRMLNQSDVFNTVLSRKELKKIAHALFTIAMGYVLDAPVQFQKLISNPHVNCQSYVKNGKYKVDVEYGEVNTADDLFSAAYMCLLATFIKGNLGIYSHWRTAKGTSWLLQKVPELKSMPAVELGAGRGQQSKLLNLMGANVIATDLYADRQTVMPVEMIDQAEAIKKYQSSRRIFLIEYPGWHLWYTFDVLSQLSGEWVLVLLTPDNPSLDYISTSAEYKVTIDKYQTDLQPAFPSVMSKANPVLTVIRNKRRDSTRVREEL